MYCTFLFCFVLNNKDSLGEGEFNTNEQHYVKDATTLVKGVN